MLRSFLLIFVFLLPSFQVIAQKVMPKATFILNLDYARFRYDDKSSFFEIYYSFHPQHLTYEFSDGKFRGGVNLITRLTDSQTKEELVNQKSFYAISNVDTGTVWYRFPFITKTAHVVPNGDYILNVIASDSLSDSQGDSLRLKIRSEQYGADLSLSDIELCKRIAASKDKQNQFYKNTLEIVPHPSLIFGSSTVPTVFHYLEVYNLEPGSAYTVKVEILDSKGELVREKSKRREFRAVNSVEIGSTPVTPYISGTYKLRVSLLDENDTEVAKKEKIFYIYNPHVHIARSSNKPSKTLFESLPDEELSQELEYIKYIATQHELAMIDDIKTASGKQEFLYNFWTKVSEGRLDLPPINRTQYLARVQISNERYSGMSKDGWTTDRGRVFTIFADPDEIERSPQESSGNAFEIWRYFSIENGVEFVFVDRLGFGVMELVHSTKRGELRDENWDRFLQ